MINKKILLTAGVLLVILGLVLMIYSSMANNTITTQSNSKSSGSPENQEIPWMSCGIIVFIVGVVMCIYYGYLKSNQILAKQQEQLTQTQMVSV